MKEFTYYPQNTCSVRMVFRIDETTDTIQDMHVDGGCNGNLSGIRRLIQGMKVEEVISKLKGTTCGRKNTSCPDQIATALEEYEKNKENI